MTAAESLEAIGRRRPGMTGCVVPPDDVREVLTRAKRAAFDYYRESVTRGWFSSSGHGSLAYVVRVNTGQGHTVRIDARRRR